MGNTTAKFLELLKQKSQILLLKKTACAKTHSEKARRVRRIESPMKTHRDEVSCTRLISVETESGEYAVVVMEHRDMVLKNISPGTRVDIRYKKSGRKPIFDAAITYVHPPKAEGVFCQCSTPTPNQNPIPTVK